MSRLLLSRWHSLLVSPESLIRCLHGVVAARLKEVLQDASHFLSAWQYPPGFLRDRGDAFGIANRV